MDFLFKSVFSGGDDDEERGAAAGSQASPGGAGAWGGGFGGLVKTLASTSESAIQTCRRDLGEFGMGLLNETAALREALRELPSSLGAGAREPPELAGRTVDGSVRLGTAEGEQAGDARANLVVKRVIASSEEREGEVDLSCEVDDDDDDKATEEELKGRKQRVDQLGDAQERGKEEEGAMVGGNPVENSPKLGNKADQIPVEEKAEPLVARSSKDSDDVSAVPSRPSIPEEDDLGWDEIEDFGDDDERNGGASGGSPNKTDLLKRLSTAEEDEDLSWDIEDDEPINP